MIEFKRIIFIYSIIICYTIPTHSQQKTEPITGKPDNSVTVSPNTNSGLSLTERILDPLLLKISPMFGEKGLPDTVPDFTKYCAEHITIGMAIFSATNIRWPFKFLMKAIFFASVIGWHRAMSRMCANDTSKEEYTNQAKLVNKHNKELQGFELEFKRRITNSVDSYENVEKAQREGCCAWFVFKKKVYAECTENKDWIQKLWEEFHKYAELLFCKDVRESKHEEVCKDVKLNDSEPKRPIPRSWLTTVIQLFVKLV